MNIIKESFTNFMYDGNPFVTIDSRVAKTLAGLNRENQHSYLLDLFILKDIINLVSKLI